MSMKNRSYRNVSKGRAPVRVLYLQPCANFGGAERQASIVIPQLAEWDIEVLPLVGPNETICRWLEDHDVLDSILSPDFPSDWTNARGGLEQVGLACRMFGARRRMAETVSRLIEDRGIQLVYAAMPFSWLAATEAARRAGIPIIWRAGGTLIRPFEKLLLRTWARMNPPDLLLCCSEAVKETFGPLVAAPAEVVRNGVELDRFRPGRSGRSRLRPAEASLVVGFAARLAPEKRPEDFVEMAARVSALHPGAVFLVAGEGSRRPVYEALAARLGLGDRIRFLGYVEDMTSFYAACDVLTLPSCSEGLPNMVLEAMAMQKPVVVSDLVARTGCLRHEQGGLVYPVGDVEGFAAAVDRLLSSETLRTAMGRKAYDVVRTECDARTSARQIARVIRTVTALRGLGAAPAARWDLIRSTPALTSGDRAR
jgi:glycosyltransferase involved in cell wall biosynthesis